MSNKTEQCLQAEASANVKLVCSTVLMALSALAVAWSDWYLRPAQIPGTDPKSWDAVGTIGIMLGGIGFWRGIKGRGK